LNHNEWRNIQPDVLKDALRGKFYNNEEAANKLLETGNATIVYASTLDRVMGTGLSFTEETNLQPTSWEGWNLLGKALEEVREEILENSKHSTPPTKA
jgi:ribA/ribD-fused uncharacterized protein